MDRDLSYKELQEKVRYLEARVRQLENEQQDSPAFNESFGVDGIINSFKDFILIITDKEGQIIKSNNSFSKLLNILDKSSEKQDYKIHELLPLENIVHFKDVKTRFTYEMDQLYLFDGEINIKREDKDYFFLIRKNPVLKADLVLGYFYVIVDYTRHRETRRRSSGLAAILDHTEDHATIKDLELKIVAANEALLKAAGVERLEDVIGKTDLEVFGDSEHVRKYMEDDRKAQRLKKGEYISHEEFFIYPDGKIVTTLVKKFPVFDEHENLLGTANISRDITSFKEMQQKLRDNEKKYKDIIQNQGEGVAIADKMGSFTFVNPAAERIFEVQKNQLIGRSLKEFLSGKKFNIFEVFLHKCLSGEKCEYELKITVNGGHQKVLMVTSTPSFDQTDRINGALLIFRDITERKRYERALQESEAALKQLNLTKDKFFSIIAHDLKNPFGSIMGFSEMIQRKIPLKDLDKIDNYTRYIKKASQQGYNLLENLLNWSRSQNGTLKYVPTSVSANELIDNNIYFLKEIAEKKNIEMINELKDDLFLFCDEDMINTVLRNLISNAIKFTRIGGKINLRAQKKQDCAEICISDNGVGISKEDLSRLFRLEESFSSRGTEREEGTGLGLVLCKEFVEKNKGEIWAESTPWKGSTFCFSIPLYKEN